MKKTAKIIIGAGISGLSCARVLKDCLVLEKNNFIGGLARTVEFKDFRFDLGGHRFLTHDASIKKVFKNLLGQEVLEVARKSQIYKKGRFIDYPLKLPSVFQLYPRELLGIYFSYLYRRIAQLREDSFKQRAINRFGDQLYKLIFKDYTFKIWGQSAEVLSKDLVDARLQNVSIGKFIKHLFIHNNHPTSLSDKFLYPKQGIGQLPQALAKDLEIKLNQEVTGLISSRNKITKVVVGNSQEYPCDKLVSTMAIKRLIDFLPAGAKVREAAQRLRYRDLICIFLVINAESFSKNHWIYFPDDQIFGRLHEPKNWSLELALENKTGVCLEIFANRGDSYWRMSDQEIAEKVIKDLGKINPLEVEDYYLVRVQDAYPIYDIDYQDNLSLVNSYLSGYKNLFLLGRTGCFKYINMDKCIAEGRSLGYNLINQDAKEENI